MPLDPAWNSLDAAHVIAGPAWHRITLECRELVGVFGRTRGQVALPGRHKQIEESLAVIWIIPRPDPWTTDSRLEIADDRKDFHGVRRVGKLSTYCCGARIRALGFKLLPLQRILGIPGRLGYFLG